MPSTTAPRHPAPNTRTLWLLLFGAILYLSLFPLNDWALRHPSPWSWLGNGMPRLYAHGDLLVNVLAYAVLGLLSARLLQHRFGRLPSLLLATLTGTLLSISMESLQAFLPRRVPSLLDLAANAAGALLGATLAVLLSRGLQRPGQPQPTILPGSSHQRAAVWLLALWLASQCAPQQLLLACGPIAPWPGAAWLGLPTGILADASWRLIGESLLVACSMSLAALLVFELNPHPVLRLLMSWGLLALALALRLSAAPHIYNELHMWKQHIVGQLGGLLLGLLMIWLLRRHPSGTRCWPLPVLATIVMLLALLLPADPGFEQLLTHRPSGLVLKAATPALRSLLHIVACFWPLAVLYVFARPGQREAAMPLSLAGR